jgi:hypothetical protein
VKKVLGLFTIPNSRSDFEKVRNTPEAKGSISLLHQALAGCSAIDDWTLGRLAGLCSFHVASSFIPPTCCELNWEKIKQDSFAKLEGDTL